MDCNQCPINLGCRNRVFVFIGLLASGGVGWIAHSDKFAVLRRVELTITVPNSCHAWRGRRPVFAHASPPLKLQRTDCLTRPPRLLNTPGYECPAVASGC